MEQYPLVSVIVITYNSSMFVLDTLESVKSQTYKNIELIISDDYSNDNTVSMCDKWLQKNKDRFVCSQIITAPKNSGISSNINRGIKASSGKWIKTIAGDDELVETCLEFYMNYAKQHNEVKVMHSNVYTYRNTFDTENLLKKGEVGHYRISRPGITSEEQYEILLRTNKINAASIIMAKDVFKQVGYFDESAKLWEDRPMLLKLTKNNIKLTFVDIYSAKYRKHSGSVQKDSKKIISEFKLDRHKYFIKNYLSDLSFFEKVSVVMIYCRNYIFTILGLNKKKYLYQVIFKICGIPWEYIVRKYKECYV